MVAVKKTLLQIIQDILSDTDGEPINSISDSLEGEQCAVVIEGAFYDLVAPRGVPEHQELDKLVPFSDNLYPTHFRIPENVVDITKVWYDKSDDDTLEYELVRWCEPDEFLRKTDGRTENYQSVTDVESTTKLRIRNDKHPDFYTSFDDYTIIMDSFKATVDDTLRESKSRIMCRKLPVFNRFDDEYVIDLDPAQTQYLINESRSRFMDWFKGGATPKAEQASRRVKSYMQNDQHRIKRENQRNKYGRHS